MHNGESPTRPTPGSSLRLLVINWQDRLHPRAGGAEVHLHEVFGRLARRGHEVTLVTCGWPGAAPRERVDGIDVHRVGTRKTFGWEGVRYARRLSVRQAFDVIVDDFNKAPHYAPLWARRPVLLIVHHFFGATAFQASSAPVASASWLLERTLPRVYRNTPVQAVSESTADELVRRGFRREQVRVVHNGVDLAFYSPAPAGVRSPEPLVLYLGRLQRYKRVDLVLKAMAELAAHGAVARLVVAGKGAQDAALRRLARELGIADRVEFAGHVSEERKRELYRSAWVHVLTSPKEGWGLTVMEAAACGTPTVASNSPGVRDAVVHGDTGILVPHGDVTALADAIRALLSDRARVEELGARARRFAERFPWERAASETEVNLRAVARGRHVFASEQPTLRRRDAAARTPLPRTGTPAVPFGCTHLVVRVDGPAGAGMLDVAVGARDAEGRHPAVSYRWRDTSRARGATQAAPPDAAREIEVVRELDGWPSDPVEYATALARELVPEANDVRAELKRG